MQLVSKGTHKFKQKYLQSSAKTPAIAHKKNSNCTQLYLQLQVKMPAIEDNLLTQREYFHLQNASKLACILQVKLTATCVIY